MTNEPYKFKVARATTPLRHDVTESIRTAIALGRFPAGKRMREREVCEMTGVSRTLVREALRQLESEGVIEVVAHRGPVVAFICENQARGIYQVREVLEGLAAELFALNATEDVREALKDAVERLREAYKEYDPVAILEAKNEFYACIISGTGNDALGRSIGLLNARAMLLRARSIRTSARREQSMREVDELVEALVSGDADRARACAVDHVRAAAKIVLDSYRLETGG